MTCYHEEGSPPEKNGDLDAVGGGGGGVAVVPHPQMALHLSGDVFSPC